MLVNKPKLLGPEDVGKLIAYKVTVLPLMLETPSINIKHTHISLMLVVLINPRNLGPECSLLV